MYYPKSRVITNKIALPGELIFSSGKEYSGKYWMTYDGKYFGGEYPDITKKLIKSSVVDIISPNSKILNTSTNSKLIRINSSISVVDLKDPNPFYPNPTNEDYDNGNIIRYFAKQRKIRNYKFIEIDKNTFEDIDNQNGIYNYPMWDVTSIFWKISGPLVSTFNGNIITRAGVIDTNQRLVILKNREFIGINEYLTDFKEFYKE
jgi:hypothetical protein